MTTTATHPNEARYAASAAGKTDEQLAVEVAYFDRRTRGLGADQRRWRVAVLAEVARRAAR